MAEKVITFKRGRREINVLISNDKVVVGSQVYEPKSERLVRLISSWIANGFEPHINGRVIRRPLSPEQRAAIASAVISGETPEEIFARLTKAGVKLGERVTALRYAIGVAKHVAQEGTVNSRWDVEPDTEFMAALQIIGE